MSSPFYRGASSGGGSGPGVSEAGGQGAVALFGEIKTAVNDAHSVFTGPSASEEAAAKAAADAYAGTNAAVPEKLEVQQDFPDLELKNDIGARSQELDFSELGKSLTEFFNNMGDMLNQLASNPIGFLSSLLNFFIKLFTDMAAGLSQALAEAARQAAAACDELLKKQLEMANEAIQHTTGLQPLELFNQQATTQTVSHALKNTASNT